LGEKPSRADIVSYLVAICVKNNINPNNSKFAGLIIKVCADKFGYDKYKSRSYIDTMISAWRLNHWKSYIKESPYLTPKEKERWLKEYGE